MKRTAKDVVIDSLINKKNLGIKEIENEIKTNYDKEFSYHSIYKAIKELNQKGVLILNKTKYSLSDEWVKEQITLFEKLKKHEKEEINTLLEFNSIKDLHDFIKKFEKEKVKLFDESIKGKVIFITNHCYNYLLQPAKELNHLKNIIKANNETMVLCYGDSVLDNWIKKTYEKKGAKFLTDSGIGGLAAINIYDNYAIQIFYGKLFLRALEKTFLETEEIEDLDMAEIFDSLADMKYKISVIIFDDKTIIESLRERALLTFERKQEK